LVFAGTQAINAVFAVSITAQYVAYSIPIGARWIWRKENGWKPGVYSLGAWVRALAVSVLECETRRVD
jgi:amino acid transporter